MRIGIWMLTVLCLFAIAACEAEEPKHQLKEGEEPAYIDGVESSKAKITEVSLIDDSSIQKFKKVEFRVDVAGFEGNPFDPDEIDLHAVFTSPSGKTLIMPAFWYQPYGDDSIALNIGGKQIRRPGQSDTPNWRIRFTPTEPGKWTYDVVLNVAGSKHDHRTGQFDALDSNLPGFVRIEPERKRHFVFDNGEPYIPVGENAGWGKLSDYEKWYPSLSENGANFSRVWMAPWGFAIVWKDTGLTDYTNRMDRAFDLDKVMELAEENGIYTMLALLNHGQFSSKINPEWQDNPYNPDNGGYLTYPGDFFTNEQAIKEFKQRLRYIVARWGYSTHIMSWELWNEVNWIDNYKSSVSAKWHKEMAEYIRSIDPYGHLVSSSHGTPDKPLLVPELDFINVHGYEIKNFANYIPKVQRKLEVHGQPVLFSEFGIAHDGGATFRMDPEGIHIHQGLWAGMLGGGAGTAMTWWWDSYIHPGNLYFHFQPVSTFSKIVPWNDPAFQDVDESEYSFTDYTVRAHGYRTDRAAYLWIYDHKYTYENKEAAVKERIGITLKLPPGDYNARWFDTYAGVVVKEQSESASQDGILTLTIPTWSKDIALIIEPAN